MKLTLSISLVVFANLNAFGDEPIPQTVEFNRDVRPILSDTCFACHGPDNGKRKAELRFDTEAGLATARKGSILSAKKPDTSGLIQRITSTDADEVMPPPATGRKLSSRQVAILKRWVEQGAPWQKHWAYIPPTRPRTSEPGNPLDGFLVTRMRREGL